MSQINANQSSESELKNGLTLDQINSSSSDLNQTLFVSTLSPTTSTTISPPPPVSTAQLHSDYRPSESSTTSATSFLVAQSMATSNAYVFSSASSFPNFSKSSSSGFSDDKQCSDEDGWPQTECGELAIQNCTWPYQGTSLRLCYSSCQWSTPQLTHCRLPRLAEIHSLVRVLLYTKLTVKLTF